MREIIPCASPEVKNSLFFSQVLEIGDENGGNIFFADLKKNKYLQHSWLCCRK